MLSILIPIYNYEVTQLVSDLSYQLVDLNLVGEIRCYDDASEEHFQKANAQLGTIPLVIYQNLAHNLGRAAIRNKLATEAQYETLLFLDCDSGIVRSSFLSEYMQHRSKEIVTGGRIYPVEPPIDTALSLHWKYGHQRESKGVAERKQNPYTLFHSNNFLIQKDLFLDIKFDEGIRGYGYEDLVLAKALQSRGIMVTVIDNPVMHLCIERNEEFLSKTRKAVQNLYALNQQGLHMNTKLERASRRISRFGMGGLFSYFYKRREASIMQNLLSADPNLRFLAYYKLKHYLACKS